MRRIYGILLSLAFAFVFACFLIDVKAETDEKLIDVTFIYDQDNEVKPEEPIKFEYGSNFAFTATPESGYEFAFWVVNGVVRPELKASDEFTVSTEMTLLAVFNSENKHTVLFIDSNGKLIDKQFVASGGNASAPVDLPDKPGMRIRMDNPWKTQDGEIDLTNITKNMVFVLQYEVDESKKGESYVLTVDGAQAGTYGYNQVAVVTADEYNDENVPFSHWEEDGQRLSYARTYALTMLKDRDLTAVYAENIAKMPLVSMSDVYDLRAGYYSFTGQIYLPAGYALVEAGLLLSDKTEVLKKGDIDVEVIPVPKQNLTTNEFLASLPREMLKKSVRAYLVVRDNNSNVLTFHSYNQLALVSEQEFERVSINPSPVISGASDKTILVGETFVPLEGVTVTDDTDGECAVNVNVLGENGDPVENYGDFSDLNAGVYTIVYSAVNSLSNTAEVAVTLTIELNYDDMITEAENALKESVPAELAEDVVLPTLNEGVSVEYVVLEGAPYVLIEGGTLKVVKP
ncbi:MAG: hypothetical protein WCZ85_06955, partial [Bacilli bacterium]